MKLPRGGIEKPIWIDSILWAREWINQWKIENPDDHKAFLLQAPLIYIYGDDDADEASKEERSPNGNGDEPSEDDGSAKSEGVRIIRIHHRKKHRSSSRKDKRSDSLMLFIKECSDVFSNNKNKHPNTMPSNSKKHKDIECIQNMPLFANKKPSPQLPTFVPSIMEVKVSYNQGIAPKGKCTRVSECWVALEWDYTLGGCRISDLTPEPILSCIGCRVSGILKKRRELWCTYSYVAK